MTTTKALAEALRKAYEALMLSRPGSENNEPTEEEWQAHFEARRTARDALAKFDAQAAEQAAGGGEAVPYCHIYEYDSPLGLHRALYPKQWNGSLPNRTVPVYAHPAPAAPVQPVGEREAFGETTTGETNGRHDGLRRDLHGGLALGGYTLGALADLLFASDDVMSLNAELDLTMDQLVQLAQAVLSTLSARPEPSDAAAPTYSSTQATNCASCGEHKHTPLRIDAMGGYVCLTCIDKKLGGMLGEFGYEPDAEIDALRWRGLEWTQQADSHGPIFVAVVRRNMDGSPWNVDAAIDAALAARGGA